ncbi:MAG: hypothetical protein HY588_01800 [Candidatus Omnitrophica bacterium]|nr:hypothetical protein [Candidatus Omnitrophota bacterium]
MKQLRKLNRAMENEGKTSFFVLISVVLFALMSTGAWWEGRAAKEEKKEEEKAPSQKVSSQTSPQTALSVKAYSQVNPAEINRIQKDLREIINRTRQLQSQVKNNRTEMQSILQRAQIHERILQEITVPPRPIQTKTQLDPEEVVKLEKLRLISEQTRETQEKLRQIQNTRMIQSAQAAPIKASSKSS